LLGALLPGVVSAQIADKLTISEQAGVTTTNYPVQIGRPFVQGEIPNYPQALLNGTPVATQADVKQRWPDGSVKHAILAFLIPNFPARSSVTVTFQNQGTGNNTPLSQAQMLGSNFNFDAQIQLSNGSTVTASALAMLTAAGSCSSFGGSPPPLCQLWTSGQIAQTVILADHSTNRAYDIGFDSNRAFRPIFIATFWPTINKVMVRFIGENASTQALENQTYSLALTVGQGSTTPVYGKPAFTQSGATRWTKVYWIGGAPSPVAIDHNLRYLEGTLFIPNYDPTVALTVATVNTNCNNWNNANQDIGGAGNWDKNMPDPGSRPDIGPFPDWTVLWLYSGSACMQATATGNADLAASWPIHIREGKSGKIMLRTDPPGSSTGLGHVVSISGRPTVNGYNNMYTVPADQINPVGAMSTQGWTDDTGHEPDVASVEYLLTGDFWYLEEMWFFAGYDISSDYYGSPYFRGPTGAEGILSHTQIRAEAWELRNFIETAFLSPDSTLEQSYFTTLINDAISCEEGMHNITTTSFHGSAIWNYCRNNIASSDSGAAFPGSAAVAPGTVTPLHQWAGGNSIFVQEEYGICGTAGDARMATSPPCNAAPTVSAATSLFESDYVLYSLGRANELGYPSGALLAWLGSLYTGMLTDPNFNPYMVDNGRVPTMDMLGNYFPTFAALKTGYTPAWQARTALSTGSDPDGYAAYVISGLSYLTGQPNGSAAWNFMRGNYNWSVFSTLPKWAVAPRGVSATAISSCDLNQDGVVDAADVQISINQALGLASCTGDLTGTGTCSVVDTQRVVNAALGGSCRLGP
jgi:hypothetical protein